MNSISLVCAVHNEVGLANAGELHAILARLQPEVIFLEVPAAAFDDFYGICIRANLESIAVRKYRECNRVELVPIDLPTPAREFFEDREYLYSRTSEMSHVFRQLSRKDFEYVRDLGFAYLNSEHCSKLRYEIDEEMLSTIRKIADARLIEIYESWMKANVVRERAWMETIQRYCGEKNFDKGVFLVGAAHRQSIIDIARKQSEADSAGTQWDFDGGVCEMTREKHE